METRTRLVQNIITVARIRQSSIGKYLVRLDMQNNCCGQSRIEDRTFIESFFRPIPNYEIINFSSRAPHKTGVPGLFTAPGPFLVWWLRHYVKYTGQHSRVFFRRRQKRPENLETVSDHYLSIVRIRTVRQKRNITGVKKNRVRRPCRAVVFCVFYRPFSITIATERHDVSLTQARRSTAGSNDAHVRSAIHPHGNPVRANVCGHYCFVFL